LSRQVYQLDTENTEYTKVGDMTFEFRGAPQLIALFKNPNAVLQGRTRGFRAKSFEIVPGPPQDGDLLYRVELERLT
jgi:hypothetical protein